jgi:hypothetical protein
MLLEFPKEITDLTVAHAMASPCAILAMAATCNLLRKAVLEAYGVDTIFRLTVLVAASGDIRHRVRAIQRATRSHLSVTLFKWPPQTAEPRPSPLREFFDARSGTSSFAMPVERNLAIRAVNPHGDIATELEGIDRINMWSNYGRHNSTVKPVDQIESIQMNGQYYLFGAMAQPANVRVIYQRANTICCSHVEVVIAKPPQ